MLKYEKYWAPNPGWLVGQPIRKENCFVKWIRLINFDTTHLYKQMTRFDPFNKQVILG